MYKRQKIVFLTRSTVVLILKGAGWHKNPFFFKEPMSFAAKGEKKKSIKSRQTPHTVPQKLSPKLTQGPLNTTMNEGAGCRKNEIF